MPIQWFPGHIAKAQRLLKDQMKVVDLVLEVVDARIPASSRYTDPGLFANKPRIVIFTKSDIADPKKTRHWISALREQGLDALEVIPPKKIGLKELKSHVGAHARTLSEKMKGRGRLPRPIRAMVIGMPNVGKSSLINVLVGKHAAHTGDRAGITRAPQWIRIAQNLELLDTPGLIPPKLEDQAIALKLALTGGISSEAYDPEEVAREGMDVLRQEAPEVLERYGNPEDLEGIAKHRGFLLPGGRPDIDRAAKTFLSELRQGTAGPMTLDPPPEGEAP